MKTDTDKQFGMSLPEPTQQQNKRLAPDSSTTSANGRQDSAGEELASISSQAAGPLANANADADASRSGQAEQQPKQYSPNASSAKAEEEEDYIDRLAIKKAHVIIEETKEDPFNQSNQILHLRAEFLKKKYDKNLKVE